VVDLVPSLVKRKVDDARLLVVRAMLDIELGQESFRSYRNLQAEQLISGIEAVPGYSPDLADRDS